MQAASLTERPRMQGDASGHDAPSLRVALLTGAQDKSYAVGLATSLLQSGASIDFIGSDSVDDPSLHSYRNLTFLNLRGSQDERVSFPRKALRLARYYLRLLGYAVSARPRIFHILWNNKFEVIDRTVLMLVYRAMGRQVTLTVHNVNAARRDGHDSWLNRVTLRIQYGLCSHLFVHTDGMRAELVSDYAVAPDRITVKAGETVRFFLKNTGKVPHEFVIGSMDELREHAEMMRRMPEMKHEEPNSITLAPRQIGAVVWQFERPGTVDFACLVPGHFEAGMVGKVQVE